MKEAYLYSYTGKDKIRCDLCSHRCVIGLGEKGKCNVRENIEGKLFTLVYDKIISENVDPIEKKPLYHFLPGSLSLSIATPGCNFKCFFCQNYEISQMPSDAGYIQGKDISPDCIVEDALKNKCESISYTYTEPTIFFELAYDTAKLANKKGLKNVFVTNGYMTEDCIDMISPYLDAANVDLKSFSDRFYRDNAGARLKPVLDNIKYLREEGIWLEITTLLIPGLNDSTEEIRKIAVFIKSIGKDIPWHISAYYPRYKAKIAPTEATSIKKAIGIAKEIGLLHPYAGNIHGSDFENTICPNCGEVFITRNGYYIVKNNIHKNKCRRCGKEIDGVFD